MEIQETGIQETGIQETGIQETGIQEAGIVAITSQDILTLNKQTQ